LKAIYTNDPDVIDPHLTTSIATVRIIDLIYENLLGWDDSQRLVPMLAESYETPDDTTYIFHLRKGVKFHNGREVVADDVLYSYNRVMNKDTGSPSKPNFDSVKTLEAVDDHTVRITLAEPTAPFLTFVASATTGIVPKEEVEQQGGNLKKAAVGTGPFKFVEYVPKTRVKLDKNPDYWM